VASSLVASRPALPHGQSRGGELGEERWLMGGSRPSMVEAHARAGLASRAGAAQGRCRAGPARRKRPTTLF
jgi:hypothetical protein